jgi:GT2 family glycosyltransferase
VEQMDRVYGENSCEVFVVDNNSVDGSMAMVKEKFTEVIAIDNAENVGFSKANNQAIKIAKGEYVLLLNPDTVVQKDTFVKTIQFMDITPDAGGLGVYMMDGKGKFLPESKRGLPTPMVSFYKIFGLSALFPKSKVFSRYHLGFLDRNEIHEIDVLSGAFMLMRKEALDKVGLLDETFFMYGEDVDLSYRITQGGYKNYYYPHTKIIHYKGESTKKGNLNYVFVFYRAMAIFVNKHFSGTYASLYTLVIHIAIYLRAAMSLVSRFLKSLFHPLIDGSLLFVGMLFLKFYWEKNHRYVEGGTYPQEFTLYIIPIYVCLWILGLWLSGGYLKPVKVLKILRGVALGTLIILVAYSLFPEEYRYSRALVILGAAWAFPAMFITRFIKHFVQFGNINIESGKAKRTVIVGTEVEVERVSELLNKQVNLNLEIIGFVNDIHHLENKETNLPCLGSSAQLKEVVSIYEVDEVIFCSSDIEASSIMQIMSDIDVKNIDYKIVPAESEFIVGSNSINTQGELYSIDLKTITLTENKRNKRILDILLSFTSLILFPLSLFVVKKPFELLKNATLVFVGKYSWVGYAPSPKNKSLPLIKKSVLYSTDAVKIDNPDEKIVFHLNLLYAKNYKVSLDINIFIKSIRKLDREVK